MGFFDSFKEAVSKETNNDRRYRDRAFEDVDSNHGWYVCKKCGRHFRKGDMDIDHIIPQKYGGNNTRGNLQCICKHCNRSKGASLSDTLPDLVSRRIELAKRDLGK